MIAPISGQFVLYPRLQFLIWFTFLGVDFGVNLSLGDRTVWEYLAAALTKRSTS